MIVASLSNAAQIQVNNVETGLSILYPKDEFFLYNSTFDFHILVANGSYYVLNNSLYDCQMHIYNTQMHHVFIGTGIKDTDDYDRYWELNSTVTGNYGTYPYNIWCNSSQHEAGFVSSSFEITTDSEQKAATDSFSLLGVILLPLFLACFLLVGSMTMGEDHTVLRIILFLTSPIMFWVSLHFSMITIVKFYGMPELQEAIGSTVYWTAWFIAVLISYFAIYTIWKIADNIAQKKNERLRY